MTTTPRCGPERSFKSVAKAFSWYLYTVLNSYHHAPHLLHKCYTHTYRPSRGGARGVPLPPPNFSGLFLKVLHRPLTAPLVAKLALQWPHQMKMSGSAPAPIWHTLRHRFLFSKNSQRSLNFVLTILLNTCQHLPCFLTSPGVSLFSWRFAVTWQINKLQITVLAVQGCLATHEGFLVHSSWGRQQSKARHYCDRTQLFCIAR